MTYIYSDLPEQHIFHNDLTNEPLSNDDYAHVQEIWNEFDMRNLGDLHDLLVWNFNKPPLSI